MTFVKVLLNNDDRRGRNSKIGQHLPSTFDNFRLQALLLARPTRFTLLATSHQSVKIREKNEAKMNDKSTGMRRSGLEMRMEVKWKEHNENQWKDG